MGDFIHEANATEANLNYGSYVNTHSYVGLNRDAASYYSASFKQLDEAVKKLPNESQTITLLSNRDNYNEGDKDAQNEGQSAANDITSISSIQANNIRQFAQKLIAKKVLAR